MKYPLTGKILEPTNQFRFRERAMVKDLKIGNTPLEKIAKSSVPQIQTHLGLVVLQQYYRNIADREKDSGEWRSVEIDFSLGKE